MWMRTRPVARSGRLRGADVVEVGMRRRILTIAALSWSALALVSCQDQDPVGPTLVGTVDQLIQALRQQGLRVTLAEAPDAGRSLLAVPAQRVLVNESWIDGYEYPSVAAAAKDAARISGDAQPDPFALILWASTPHFYRQGRLIVLYVGCRAEIQQALEVTIGPPFVVGPTLCHFVN